MTLFNEAVCNVMKVTCTAVGILNFAALRINPKFGKSNPGK